MYGFGGVGLLEVQLSISELSVVGGWTRQTHFMVGLSQGPTKNMFFGNLKTFQFIGKFCDKPHNID